jgi:hypothetical protein
MSDVAAQTSGQVDPKLPPRVHRELTRVERAAIRKLVKGSCANYDHEYGCLLLDDNCYMFYGVAYTNTGMCKYFRNAVLPTDPAIEAILTDGGAVETRFCGICGEAFPADGKQAYCSDVCADEAHRRQKRDFIRKKRGGL